MLLAFLLLLGAISSLVSGQTFTVTPFGKSSYRLQITPATPLQPPDNITLNLPGALIGRGSSVPYPIAKGDSMTNQNLRIFRSRNDVVQFFNVKSEKLLFEIDSVTFKASNIIHGLASTTLTISRKMDSGSSQRIFGLGQGNWSTGNGGIGGGCATGNGTEHVVPLLRNGQVVNLLQRKFHISIPYIYSDAGYGLLFNHGGKGMVYVSEDGSQEWTQEAALNVDLWVTTTNTASTGPADIYQHYADATGHSPPLREDAMIFWQSRNRYKSSRIVQNVAKRYMELHLPVGVLVVDYKNQDHDGDFAPGAECYPSVSNLTTNVKKMINASTMFSFWPEVLNTSAEFKPLSERGCLINNDLSGFAFDATQEKCRDFVWDTMLKPRYFDQGVNMYWLDETDGEGTGGGGDGNHGYDTSYGPAAFASNYWVNDWISMFADNVRAEGIQEPLVLTRGVWAGGQRHGVVLWSSDVESSFHELRAQINLGVHAGLSGIPWWTSDVGGYGCGFAEKNMSELMIRWYQFGCFSPIFRTHGCRATKDPDKTIQPCQPKKRSCGPNEVWSYGKETQVVLEKYIQLRHQMKPYIQELSMNVTKYGVPTVRPLWWEFPNDSYAWDINDQYMLGPDLLVSPVTIQNASSRLVYFPLDGGDDTKWINIFNGSQIIKGGQTLHIDAPLDSIPVFRRQGSKNWFKMVVPEAKSEAIPEAIPEVVPEVMPEVMPEVVSQLLPASEIEALFSIYHVNGGKNWQYKNGTDYYGGNMPWNVSSSYSSLSGKLPDPCSEKWFGVFCNNGHVTKLFINTRFSGNEMTGELSSFIGNFTYLEHFYSSNDQTPSSLTGGIPESFGTLSRLKCMYFSHNNLTKPFPLSLSNLINLQVFLTRSNSISGPLPNFKKMPQLVNVWFDGNQLEGTLNDVGALQHLTFLKVNNNLLSGTMPSSLCNIKCDASGNKNITCPLPTTGCYGLLSNDIVW
jgi:alpha-D-xyloside xylohydrolase